ncbi:hypothetical protein BJY00DRAFT_310636 [Aspergillus carlsbadensis]|nr:hypothetical protein BJY00DRAFT_310636 [Aspergillus carlsbadensis]
MPEFMDEDIVCAVDDLELHDTAVTLQSWMLYDLESPTQGYLLRRTGLLTKLYQHAIHIGVDLWYGVNMTGYWEDAESAGIYIRNSNKKVARSCVVVAKGFHSTARRAYTSEKGIWLLRKAPTAGIMPFFGGKDVTLLMDTAAKNCYIA